MYLKVKNKKYLFTNENMQYFVSRYPYFEKDLIYLPK